MDYNDAYQMAIDAIASTIDLYKQEGDEIPKPSDPATLEHDEDWKDEFLVLVSADIEAYLKTCAEKAQERIETTIRLPRWQIKEADHWEIDLSEFVEKQLEKEIDRQYDDQKKRAFEIAFLQENDDNKS